MINIVAPIASKRPLSLQPLEIERPQLDLRAIRFVEAVQLPSWVRGLP